MKVRLAVGAFLLLVLGAYAGTPVSIRFTIDGSGHVTIPCVVDGQAFSHCVLDSGAAGSVIDSKYERSPVYDEGSTIRGGGWAFAGGQDCPGHY